MRITHVFSRLFICWLLSVSAFFVTAVDPVWAKEKSFVAVIITGDLERYRLAHEAFLEKVRQIGRASSRERV